MYKLLLLSLLYVIYTTIAPNDAEEGNDADFSDLLLPTEENEVKPDTKSIKSDDDDDDIITASGDNLDDKDC